MINSNSWYRIKLALAISALVVSSLLKAAPLQAQATDPVSKVDTANQNNNPGETPEEMRKRLNEAKQKLLQIENKKQGVNKQVLELDRERARLKKLLIDYAQRIQDSEANLTELESKLEELKDKEQQIRGSMNNRRETIAEMLGLLQRMGRNPPPIMATHREDALKMVRSAMLMSNMLPKLKVQADTLKTELDKLVSLKTNIAKKSERLRIQNAEMESDQVRMEELLQEKNSRILSHTQELEDIKKRADKHAQSVESLAELITKVDVEIKRKSDLQAYEEKLIKDEAEAKLKFGRKVAVELTPDEKKIAFKNPGRIKPALPFTQVKSTLALPVRGTLLRSFGDKMKYGNIAKGISLETRHNAQITSPSDGWIAYAGKFRSYGQLLIINAGGGYHILLAGMDRIDVKTSQFVLAGEPIGVMEDKGNTASNNKKDGNQTKQPVLYIEFRKDGAPIDPSPWWAGEPISSKN